MRCYKGSVPFESGELHMVFAGDFKDLDSAVAGCTGQALAIVIQLRIVLLVCFTVQGEGDNK